MLYKIKHGESVFELNPGLEAVEAYRKLTPQQMTFVILVCDPSRDNPIRSLSGRVRRERAAEIAGYQRESDGKRLDKNGRNIATGKIANVESAIEEFKKNHYDDKQHSIEALKQQIIEIRDFLSSEKRTPILDKKTGSILLNSEGKEQYEIDYKALESATKLGNMLPDLEASLEKLQAMAKQDEPKYEGEFSYTLDEVEDFSDGEGSMLDRIKEAERKKNEA